MSHAVRTATEEAQDDLVGALREIVGWGPTGFVVRRHPVGVTVTAKRLPGEALALTDEMGGLELVNVTHVYEAELDGELGDPHVRVTFGWV